MKKYYDKIIDSYIDSHRVNLNEESVLEVITDELSNGRTCYKLFANKKGPEPDNSLTRNFGTGWPKPVLAFATYRKEDLGSIMGYFGEDNISERGHWRRNAGFSFTENGAKRKAFKKIQTLANKLSERTGFPIQVVSYSYNSPSQEKLDYKPLLKMCN